MRFAVNLKRRVLCCNLFLSASSAGILRFSLSFPNIKGHSGLSRIFQLISKKVQGKAVKKRRMARSQKTEFPGTILPQLALKKMLKLKGWTLVP